MANRRSRVRAAAVAVALGALAASGCGSEGLGDRAARTDRSSAATVPDAAPETAPAGAATGLPDGIDAVVTSVTDGDTIVVRTPAGTVERVRLIGIDTPETRDPRRPVECFGREASRRTTELVPPGTEVRLELDVELRDRYDRLLAYVWRASDAVFVNAVLVEGGWATPARYPPNVRHADLFSRLGTEAREMDRGLWSACPDERTPGRT